MTWLTANQLEQLEREQCKRLHLAEFLKHHPEYRSPADAFVAHGWSPEAAAELEAAHNQLQEGQVP